MLLAEKNPTRDAPDRGDRSRSGPGLAAPGIDEVLASRLAPSSSPLSFGQRSLWFVHQLAPSASVYNIAAAAQSWTPIDPDLLEHALQALVNRHDALRTTFSTLDGEPRQLTAASSTFRLAREDVANWDEARLRRRLADEAWRPFDLERGPLLRLTLFTGDAGGPVLLLVIHHIIADFWSLAILMRELPELYQEGGGGAPARLAPPGLPYEEHGAARARQLERRTRSSPAGLLAPAAGRVAGARPGGRSAASGGADLPGRLPADAAAGRACRGPARSRSRAARHSVHDPGDRPAGAPIPPFRPGGLRDRVSDRRPVGHRGGRHGRLFRQPRGVARRPERRPQLWRAPREDQSRRAGRPCARRLSAPVARRTPSRPDRDASRTPFFQLSFVLQKETRGVSGLTAFALGEEGVEIELGPLRLRSLALPRPPAPFDLQLQCVERQGGLSLALQYNTDLFDGATAARLGARFETLLRAVAEGVDLRVSALPLLAEAERHQLLLGWNDTAGPGCEANLFDLFAVQAARSPQATALVFADERVAYGELAARAAGSRAASGGARSGAGSPRGSVRAALGRAGGCDPRRACRRRRLCAARARSAAAPPGGDPRRRPARGGARPSCRGR